MQLFMGALGIATAILLAETAHATQSSPQPSQPAQQSGQTVPNSQTGQPLGGQQGQNTTGQSVRTNGQTIPGQNPIGQQGQNPIGQSGKANTQTIPGQKPIGQQGQNPVGQNGNPNTQTIPGQNAIGQQGQTPVGQNGRTNMQTIPGQNPIGQQGQTPVGQNGNARTQTIPGQNAVGQQGQNPVGQNGRTNMQTIPGQNPIGQQGQNSAGRPGPGNPGQVNQPIVSTQPGLAEQFNQNIQGPMRYGYATPIYQLGEVRSSLNLTSEQVNQLNAANAQLSRQYQEQISKLNALSPAERTAQVQSIRSAQEADFLRSAGTILNAEQGRRLRQLDYQAQGPAVFNNADVRSRLNLSGDQVRRLQEVQHNHTGFMEDFLMPGGSGQDPVTRYELHQRRMNEQVNAILDPAQRQAWQELIGDPFIFRPTTDASGNVGGNQQR